MNKLKIVVAVGASVLILGGIVYLGRTVNYQRAVQNITYADLELSSVPDGTYTGECDVDFVSAKVAVTVESGRITEIQLLEHKNERGLPAEKIVEEILGLQKIDVETVAGATNSSKVIKKAVENALKNSPSNG